MSERTATPECLKPFGDLAVIVGVSFRASASPTTHGRGEAEVLGFTQETLEPIVAAKVVPDWIRAQREQAGSAAARAAARCVIAASSLPIPALAAARSIWDTCVSASNSVLSRPSIQDQ